MVRWEYKIMPIGNPGDEDFIENQLIMDAMGAAGWELITIHQSYMIFKRQNTLELC
jgi:hypothetical protein